MATVAQMLDKLVAGQLTLEQVCEDFARRRWAPPPATTDAQMWGVADVDQPGGDAWGVVEADSRLTTRQYSALAAARGTR